MLQKSGAEQTENAKEMVAASRLPSEDHIADAADQFLGRRKDGGDERRKEEMQIVRERIQKRQEEDAKLEKIAAFLRSG